MSVPQVLLAQYRGYIDMTHFYLQKKNLLKYAEILRILRKVNNRS